MNNYLILCVDDERVVLDSVLNDLAELEQHFVIEATESVAEAQSVLDSSENTKLALILCDHIMPNQLGIDFLISLNQQPETSHCKKILLTGQADLNDTISAINNADLNHFLAKPWKKDELVQIVKNQLTDYMIENDKNLLQWVSILNTEKLMNAISDKRQELPSD